MATLTLAPIDFADVMEQRNMIRQRYAAEIRRERFDEPIVDLYADLEAELERLNSAVGIQDCLNCDQDFPMDGHEYCPRCRAAL